jgi:4-amino-4-deoxy-L-arabinose transferase-like glycosyltransferase
MEGARPAVALLLLGIALRLPMLSRHRLAEGDGVHYAHLARSIVAGDFSGLANPYWSNLWPAVIAATSRLTGLDVVASGRLASLVSGALLVLLTAALAARLFGPTVGLFAGLLAAAHPWLIHFSTLVFTESLFAALVAATLLATLHARDRGEAAALAGLLGGLAVVTRPEALAVVTAAVLWLIAAPPRPALRLRFARAALLAVPVMVLLLGRGALVHRYYGFWDFGVGGKGMPNLLVGLAPTDRDKARVATEARPGGENALAQAAREGTIAGFAAAHPAILARHTARNLGRLAASALSVFPMVPLAGGRPPLWSGGWSMPAVACAVATTAVALLGLVAATRDRERWPAASLLVAAAALYVLGLAPLNVHDRLVVPLVPIFLVFAALGLARLTRRFVPDEARQRRLLAPVLVCAAIVSLAALLRAPTLDYAGDPPVQRETGAWLAAHYGQDARLMTSAPCVGFYFYDVAHARQEVTLPWATGPSVIELARQQGVRLLAVPEWHLRAVDHPASSLLLHPDAVAPVLRHVVTLGEEATGRMFVYEVPGGADLQAALP